MFLLDTDICSAYLKGDARLQGRFLQYGGRLHVSAVTCAELFAWALRAAASAKRLQGLMELLGEMVFLEVNLDVSRRFGELRARQLDQGRPMPTMDLLIAATASAHDLTLVTHNTQDFNQIPGLSLVDWLSE